MIRFKLKDVLARKAFRDARKITFADVAEVTGIHRVTLSKIAGSRGYNAGVDNVDKLCAYFDCQPGDLMEYIPDRDLTAATEEANRLGEGDPLEGANRNSRRRRT